MKKTFKTFKALMLKCLAVFKDALKIRKLRRRAKKYGLKIIYSAGNGYHVYNLDNPTFYYFDYTDDLNLLETYLDFEISEKFLGKKKSPSQGK